MAALLGVMICVACVSDANPKRAARTNQNRWAQNRWAYGYHEFQNSTSAHYCSDFRTYGFPPPFKPIFFVVENGLPVPETAE